MSNLFDSWNHFTTCVVYASAAVVFLFFLPMALIENYLDKKWAAYANSIHYFGFTGNSMELLRAVSRQHHLRIDELLCRNEFSPRKFSHVLQTISGDTNAFELFDMTGDKLGEIKDGNIVLRERTRWYHEKTNCNAFALSQLD